MFFISLEGTDGSGKSSAANFLKKYLTENGFDVVLTREPGGDIIGEKLRELILNPDHTEITPWTEALLYIACRTQHLTNVILPAIKKGEIVICERFSDSTNVYQGVARGLGLELVNQIQEIVLGYAIPDITLFLNVKPSVALKRLEKRLAEKKEGKDRLEKEGKEFFNKVYDAYKEVIAKDNGKRIKVINAETSIKNVEQQIADVIKNFLITKGVEFPNGKK